MNYTVSYSENKNMITLYQSPIKSENVSMQMYQ